MSVCSEATLYIRSMYLDYDVLIAETPDDLAAIENVIMNGAFGRAR